MGKELKVYCRLIQINLLSCIEYKGWWLMILQVLMVCASDTISTFLLFDRFGGIGVWTVERIILIYGLAITSSGLAECFCRGFDCFPWKMIRSGDFDRLLLRPKSLFTQVAASYFHIHRLSRVAAGLALITWALSRLGVSVSITRLLILLLALCGGMITYAGVFVMSSGIAFFTVQALDWIHILSSASYQVTRIPMEYIPRGLKNVFTFFMPMLVISYYPASAVCSWGEPLWTSFLALPAGAVFFGFSVLVWRFGVRHYKSTGS